MAAVEPGGQHTRLQGAHELQPPASHTAGTWPGTWPGASALLQTVSVTPVLDPPAAAAAQRQAQPCLQAALGTLQKLTYTAKDEPGGASSSPGRQAPPLVQSKGAPASPASDPPPDLAHSTGPQAQGIAAPQVCPVLPFASLSSLSATPQLPAWSAPGAAQMRLVTLPDCLLGACQQATGAAARCCPALPCPTQRRVLLLLLQEMHAVMDRAHGLACKVWDSLWALESQVTPQRGSSSAWVDDGRKPPKPLQPWLRARAAQLEALERVLFGGGRGSQEACLHAGAELQRLWDSVRAAEVVDSCAAEAAIPQGTKVRARPGAA